MGNTRETLVWKKIIDKKDHLKKEEYLRKKTSFPRKPITLSILWKKRKI